jgi:hypothetical protein
MFFFESMLTPKIITFVYWLLLFVALADSGHVRIRDGGFRSGVSFAALSASSSAQAHCASGASC